MPVYDVGYRRWEGSFGLRVLRWWPIARRGIPLLLRSRVLIVFLILGLLFTFVAQLITIVGLLQGAALMSTWFVKAYMDWMMIFCATLLVFAGAGQIAGDIRANAFQVYGSRAITWVDYYKSKFAIVATLLSLVTLVPGLAFYAFGAGSQVVLPPAAQAARSVASIAAYAGVIIVPMAALILAFSSLGKSAWFAGVSWLCIYLFPYVLAEGLAEAFASPVPYYFSLHHLLARVGWECAAWSRIETLDWLQAPTDALRDLVRGSFVSLLGMQRPGELLGALGELARIEGTSDPALLREMILQRVHELEVVPDPYPQMRLATSLATLAGLTVASIAVTLRRLRVVVLER